MSLCIVTFGKNSVAIGSCVTGLVAFPSANHFTSADLS